MTNNELYRAKIYGTNIPKRTKTPLVGLGEYSTEELMAELRERDDYYGESLSPLDSWFNKYGMVATKGSQVSAIIEMINLIKEEATAEPYAILRGLANRLEEAKINGRTFIRVSNLEYSIQSELTKSETPQ